jgi:hypothetical protein
VTVCLALQQRCPDCEALAAYIDRGLNAEERTELEEHLAACHECTAIIASVVRVRSKLRATHGSRTTSFGDSPSRGNCLDTSHSTVVSRCDCRSGGL